MKWIPVEKAKQLKFMEDVLVKDSGETIFLGRLVKKEENLKDTIYTFEVSDYAEDAATYSNDIHEINDVVEIAYIS